MSVRELMAIKFSLSKYLQFLDFDNFLIRFWSEGIFPKLWRRTISDVRADLMLSYFSFVPWEQMPFASDNQTISLNE